MHTDDLFKYLERSPSYNRDACVACHWKALSNVQINVRNFGQENNSVRLPLINSGKRSMF